LIVVRKPAEFRDVGKVLLSADIQLIKLAFLRKNPEKAGYS
jgi:hypothetical protein